MVTKQPVVKYHKAKEKKKHKFLYCVIGAFEFNLQVQKISIKDDYRLF